MLKKIFFLFFIFMITSPTAYPFPWKKIYGTNPNKYNLMLGSITYHFLQPRGKIFYPYFGFTFKNSFMFNMFENSQYRFGASVAFSRQWYSHQFTSNRSLQFGYAAGITYGYCFRAGINCKGEPGEIPFIPSFLIYSKYYFTKHAGIYAYGQVLSFLVGSQFSGNHGYKIC